MPLYRTQVVLSGSSTAPEDVFVNTYWFNSIQPNKEAQLAVVAPAFDDLYSGFASFMNGYLRSPFQVKVYNMADGEPREPATADISWPGGGTTGISNLPFELAVCVSFHGAPPFSPRRRGRVYIGPLNTKSLESGAAINALHDSTCWGNSFNIQLGAGFEQFRTSSAGGDWVVHGKGGDVPIIGGWIDDAYDIQRRRGQDATRRMIWGIE